jgi:hypothetical protein
LDAVGIIFDVDRPGLQIPSFPGSFGALMANGKTGNSLAAPADRAGHTRARSPGMAEVQAWRQLVKVGTLTVVGFDRIARRLELDGRRTLGLLASNPTEHLCLEIDITASRVRCFPPTIAEPVVARPTTDSVKRVM